MDNAQPQNPVQEPQQQNVPNVPAEQLKPQSPSKTPIIIMTIVTLISLCFSSYLAYQNIQLKKQASQQQVSLNEAVIPSPTLQPTTAPNNNSDCSGNDKYSITIQESIEGSGRGKFLVEYNNGDSNFETSEEMAICMALENDFLVLDVGTSAGPRGFIVYDLDKRAKVYTGTYVGNLIEDQPKISNNAIIYWEPSSEIATEENCPNYLYNESMGGGSAIDVHTKLDLITLDKELLGEQKCNYRE